MCSWKRTRLVGPGRFDEGLKTLSHLGQRINLGEAVGRLGDDDGALARVPGRGHIPGTAEDDAEHQVDVGRGGGQLEVDGLVRLLTAVP